MANREKVKKGLECCKASTNDDPFQGCSECPYNDISISVQDCRAVLSADALELLKEQKAVKPKYNARTNWYECGNCHYSMTSGMNCRSELIPATKVRYCANCGFPVNWEGR